MDTLDTYGYSAHKKEDIKFPIYKYTMNSVCKYICVCVYIYVHKYKTQPVRAPVSSYPPWVAQL